VAIFVLVLWLATAVAGLTLLRAGGAARRPAGQASQPEPVTIAAGRIGALPMTPDGKPPKGPHTRVQVPAGQHPILEFSHPVLAVTGIACWMMFAFIHYRPLAWIAFAILVVTLLAGLTWLRASRRADRAQTAGTRTFPPRLVLTHGLVAGGSILLTVLTALTASHG
jgi:hypothetical protein